MDLGFEVRVWLQNLSFFLLHCALYRKGPFALGFEGWIGVLWRGPTSCTDFSLLLFLKLARGQYLKARIKSLGWLTCPGFPRTFLVLVLTALFLGKPISPRQTRTFGYPRFHPAVDSYARGQRSVGFWLIPNNAHLPKCPLISSRWASFSEQFHLLIWVRIKWDN